MKTTNQPNKDAKNAPGSKESTKGATNPKKPNNDPDQTPDREVENIPRAKPGTKTPDQKNKIGFKK